MLAIQRVLAFLRLESVYVHGSIRGLGCYEFIERIPRHTLDEVGVVGNLPDDASFKSC